MVLMSTKIERSEIQRFVAPVVVECTVPAVFSGESTAPPAPPPCYCICAACLLELFPEICEAAGFDASSDMP